MLAEARDDAANPFALVLHAQLRVFAVAVSPTQAFRPRPSAPTRHNREAMRACFLVAVAAVAAVACSSAPTRHTGPPELAREPAPYTAALDVFLERAAAVGAFNGTVLIAENGVIRYERSLGVRNPTGSVPLSPRSSFRLASVSKQFIATAIMILAQRKTLAYDDPLSRFVPELDYPGVTIRHLLNHTSGLPDYIGLMASSWDAGTEFPKRRIADNEDVIGVMATSKPAALFAPGERFQYSNTGYMLLGSIIARASKMSIHEFLARHMFEPLRMRDSAAFRPTDDFLAGRRVIGFVALPDGEGTRANDFSFLNGVVGDGGVYASARDLVLWDLGLRGAALVPQAALAEAFKPATLKNGSLSRYGFGWGLSEDGKTAAHSGSWVGFRTFIERELEGGRVIIVLSSNSSERVEAIVEGVSAIAGGKEVDALKRSFAPEIARAVAAGADLDAAFAALVAAGDADVAGAESSINVLGYHYLGNGALERALAVFRLNSRMFPESWNVHDSLGEALAKSGARDEAIASYRRSLERLPSSASGKKALATVGAEPPPAFAVAPDRLTDYVGRYRHGDDTIELSRDDDGLVATARARSIRVKPASDDVFYAAEPSVSLVFRRGEAGVVDVVIYRGTRRKVYERFGGS